MPDQQRPAVRPAACADFEFELVNQFSIASAYLDLDCFSAYIARSNIKIGGHKVDLATVWSKPGQLHRRWLGLGAKKDGSDDGEPSAIEGYLRVSKATALSSLDPRRLICD